MITRIIIAIVAVLFLPSIAFGQLRYSRPKSWQSPTPTPTPKPTTTPSRGQLLPTPTPQSRPTATPWTQMKPAPSPSRTQLNPTATPARTQVKSTPMPLRPQLMSKPTPMSALAQPKPTPTPIPPPDVKAYLDRQLANSKDKKFHLTVNGKDLPLTPFHVWAQKSTGVNSTSTCIDMRSDDGRVYDIDFVTTGAQVSSVKIHRINGEAVR